MNWKVQRLYAHAINDIRSLLELVFIIFFINQSKSVLTCIRGYMLLLAYFTRFPAFGLNSDWFIGFWYPCCD